MLEWVHRILYGEGHVGVFGVGYRIQECEWEMRLQGCCYPRRLSHDLAMGCEVDGDFHLNVLDGSRGLQLLEASQRPCQSRVRACQFLSPLPRPMDPANGPCQIFVVPVFLLHASHV